MNRKDFNTALKEQLTACAKDLDIEYNLIKTEDNWQYISYKTSFKFDGTLPIEIEVVKGKEICHSGTRDASYRTEFVVKYPDFSLTLQPIPEVGAEFYMVLALAYISQKEG